MHKTVKVKRYVSHIRCRFHLYSDYSHNKILNFALEKSVSFIIVQFFLFFSKYFPKVREKKKMISASSCFYASSSTKVNNVKENDVVDKEKKQIV